MNLTNTPTPTTTPDTDNDTPPHTQPVRPFSFTNGRSKNHNYHHQPPPQAAVAYRECLKNHAANIGGHALDGCGEFTPSHTATPTDPSTLKCAACGCHRNFHRRAFEEYSPFITTMTPHSLDFRHPKRFSPSPSPPPPPSQMLLSLSTPAHDDQEVPTHHNVTTPATAREAKASDNLSGKKRFRTKFSQEQKEKMHSFAEKLGWKMQKCDANTVQNFCNEIGVARGVLKVWMHNNKYTFGRRDISNNTISNINLTNMEQEDNIINASSIKNDEEDNSGNGSHCNNEIGYANPDQLVDHHNTNGASSSS